MTGYYPGPPGRAVLWRFLSAFCESSFFPIPPDILLIALAVGAPLRAFYFVFVCSVGSLLGGIAGYFIGWQFMGTIGQRIVDFYGLAPKVEQIAALYQNYDAWAVSIAGFTPLPYKLFTITAGAFNVDFYVFVVASAASRTLRFAILGGLIYWLGPGVKNFIDRYFNLLATVFTLLLVAGFVVIKYLV